MVIGINGYEAIVGRFGNDVKTNIPKRVGSSEYCFELLVNLHKIDIRNQYIIFLPQNPTPDLPKNSKNWYYKVLGPKRFWMIFGLSLELLFRRSKIDLLFSPTHYLPIFSPYKSAISVLDLSFIHFPELFKKKDLYQLKNWTSYSVKKASRVFTISNASKDDIIQEYGIPKEKVFVTYPGIKKVLSSKNKILSMDEIKNKYGIEGEYILFVGTLQPRKNIVRLIEAFSKISNIKYQKSNISLIIIGKKGWMYEEILNSPKKFNIDKKVKFLENVSDEDLPYFYKNAFCFALPSLYEGFGLPVLEAMKYGCPVITSNISSLPEAGGNAALYVDPENVDDISLKIEILLNDKKLRENLIKKGYEQVKKFSWEKTARETLKALESIK